MDFIHKFRPILCLVLLLLLGVGIYARVLNGPPIFDDIGYIQSNARIHDITDLSAIWRAWKHPARFFGYFTFALNYHFHGYNYFGYHLVNLIIHLINTTLVWLFVRQIFITPRLRDDPLAKQREAMAFITAALFVTHPIQTQAVSYMAQRFASMATMFYLLSVFCYGQGRIKGGRKGGIYFLIAAISALLGMFTKQITITLPVTVLLYEFLFFRKKGEPFKISWKLTSVVLLFLLVVPAIFSFRVIDMLTINHTSSGSHRGEALNSLSYLMTQFRVVGTYIRLMFFPIGQNLLYDFKTSYFLFEPKTFSCLIMLMSLFIYGLYRLKNNILIAFGIFWFFIALSVESSIITIKHVIFEHRMYLPSFGFFLFCAASLMELFRSQRKCIVTVCVIVLTLAALTYQRNYVWSDDIAMWQDVIKKSPEKSRPYMNMGIAHLQRGQYDTAINYYDLSIEKYHRNYAAFSNRGMAHFAMGNRAQAIKDFDEALSIKDDYIEAYINRGNYYSFMKDYQKAIADYNMAIKFNPSSVEAILNRGNKYFKLKEYDAAIQDYSKSIELRPSFAQGYQHRAEVYLRLKEFDLALDDYSRAIDLDQEMSGAFFGRGNLHFKNGNLHLALNDYNRALAINPKHQKAQQHRDKLLAFMKMKDRISTKK